MFVGDIDRQKHGGGGGFKPPEGRNKSSVAREASAKAKEISAEFSAKKQKFSGITDPKLIFEINIDQGVDPKGFETILSSMDILGSGLVPLALVTLGAQLANTKFSFKLPRVYISNVMRLIISPIIAFGLTQLMGLHGIVGQVLVICSAAPTAVNSVLIALEYDNEPDYAAQAIFTSTIFSSFTVTLVIYLATRLV